MHNGMRIQNNTRVQHHQRDHNTNSDQEKSKTQDMSRVIRVDQTRVVIVIFISGNSRTCGLRA
eukprot:10317551-Lingulodinium_polyedra.AAC.1